MQPRGTRPLAAQFFLQQQVCRAVIAAGSTSSGAPSLQNSLVDGRCFSEPFHWYRKPASNIKMLSEGVVLDGDSTERFSEPKPAVFFTLTGRVRRKEGAAIKSIWTAMHGILSEARV
jgi:hypothetical protein